MAIIRTTGFVPLRRGLFEHVVNGDMAPLECFLYSAILASADPKTGIWISSAGVLSGLFGIPHRTCRDLLEKLEKSGYVKRFPVQGRHGSYPILVHLFDCSDGAMKGMRLNAKESKDYKNPVYFSRHDDVNEGVNDNGNDGVNESATKNIDKQKTRELEKKTKAILAPDWIPKEQWDGYVDYRRTKGKFTQRAVTLTISELEKLKSQGYDPGQVLDQSVQKGWTGVFPISKNGGSNGNHKNSNLSGPTERSFAHVQGALLDIGEQAIPDNQSGRPFGPDAQSANGPRTIAGMVPGARDVRPSDASRSVPGSGANNGRLANGVKDHSSDW